MFCTRCGTKNPDNSANCYNCGQNMGKVPDRTLQTRSGSLAEVRAVKKKKKEANAEASKAKEVPLLPPSSLVRDDPMAPMKDPHPHGYKVEE